MNIAAGYAEHLVATWNARQEAHMPMLFSPGAALAARHWFLWVRYPACRITNAVDLRAFMKLSRDCHDFIDKMDTHYPRFGEQYRLPFDYEPDKDDGKSL